MATSIQKYRDDSIMDNREQATKLRGQQAQQTKADTTKAVANAGASHKMGEVIAKQKEELSSARSIIKDKDARIAELEHGRDEDSKRIDTLNAMIEQSKKEAQEESEALHKQIEALKKAKK